MSGKNKYNDIINDNNKYNYSNNNSKNHNNTLIIIKIND